MSTKKLFFSPSFGLILSEGTGTFTLFFKSKKSGSVSLTNGFGSGKPKLYGLYGSGSAKLIIFLKIV
jgi:hypothetical protein